MSVKQAVNTKNCALTPEIKGLKYTEMIHLIIDTY